jgi:outer membrane protein insertion porin family
MMVGQVSAAYNSPHDAAQVMASLEQSMPLSNEWLNFNRLRLRAEAPLQMGPVGLNLRAKGGAIYGDLPPYEAFPIGGTNSVRGYGEGGVGSGR